MEQLGEVGVIVRNMFFIVVPLIRLNRMSFTQLFFSVSPLSIVMPSCLTVKSPVPL